MSDVDLRSGQMLRIKGESSVYGILYWMED